MDITVKSSGLTLTTTAAWEIAQMMRNFYSEPKNEELYQKWLAERRKGKEK